MIINYNLYFRDESLRKSKIYISNAKQIELTLISDG